MSIQATIGVLQPWLETLENPVRWILIALCALSSFPAAAIKLDCVAHGDGTYTCVEIENVPGAAASAPSEDAAGTIDDKYTRQAREQCTYRKPHARAGGKLSRGAARMEAEKNAQEDYERCVINQAAALRQLGD